MVTFLKTMQVSQGVIVGDRAPEDEEEQYTSVSELKALFGCTVTDADIRFAMGLINAYTNRASLWPCQIEESLRLPSDQQRTRCSVTPVVHIETCLGRATYGRRDRQGLNAQQYGLGGILALMGGKPTWQPLPVEQIDFDQGTGTMWLPYNVYCLPYNEIRISYLAGYLTIPLRIKESIAIIINDTHARGPSSRIRHTIGRITNVYADSGYISQQVQQLLEPMRVVSLF